MKIRITDIEELQTAFPQAVKTVTKHYPDYTVIRALIKAKIAVPGIEVETEKEA